MLNKRTNILFEEKQWKQLATIAKERKTSVGQLIRQVVALYLVNGKQKSIEKACKSILAIRKKQKGKVDYKALIDYGRKH